MFPDSSQFAFGFALSATSTDTSLWCDVQLTKDGVGFCLRDLLMQNGTTISQVYPGGKQTYRINGVPKTGWFPVDYNMSLLINVFCEFKSFSAGCLLHCHNMHARIYTSTISIFVYNENGLHNVPPCQCYHEISSC